MSKREHTLAEQLAELAGARQLATATFLRTTDPELKKRARQLMGDIRRQHKVLRRELLAGLAGQDLNHSNLSRPASPDVLIVDSETGEHVEAPAEYARAATGAVQV